MAEAGAGEDPAHQKLCKLARGEGEGEVSEWMGKPLSDLLYSAQEAEETSLIEDEVEEWEEVEAVGMAKGEVRQVLSTDMLEGLITTIRSSSSMRIFPVSLQRTTRSTLLFQSKSAFQRQAYIRSSRCHNLSKFILTLAKFFLHNCRQVMSFHTRYWLFRVAGQRSHWTR